jgi:PAS domain S-box-containing protein
MRLLNPPQFIDEEQNQTARQMHFILWTIILAATLLIPVLVLVVPDAAHRWWVMAGGIDALCLVLLALSHRGYTRLASILFVLFSMIVISEIAFTSGGVRSPGIYAFIIIVFIAGLLLEIRSGIITALLSCFIGLGFSYAASKGGLPPASFNHTDYSLWISLTFYLAVAVGLQYLFSSSVRKSLQKVLQELDKRSLTETALSDSLERYQNQFEKSHAVMLVINPDTAQIVDANPAACDFYGWTLEEIKAKKIDEINILTPEEVHAELQLAVTEKRNHFFFKHRLADGAIRDVEIYNGPLILKGKTYLYSIIHDITDRVRAETALRESHEQLNRILENLQDAYFQVDISGKLAIVNPAAVKMYGYGSIDEMIGKPAETLYAKKSDREPLIDELQRSSRVTDWSCIGLRKDGTEFWVSMNVQFLFDEKGQVVGTEGVVRDISERRKAEDALSESQALTTAIMNSTSDLIWSVNPETFGLQTFNRGLDDYFLKDRGIQIRVGMQPEDLFPPGEFVDQWNGFYQRALREGRFTEEYDAFTGLLILQLTFNLLQRDGQIFGISVFGKDITERGRAEQQLRESTERLREAQRLSHIGNWELDLSTNKLIWSDEIYQILEIDPAKCDATYEALFNAIHPEDRESVNKAYVSSDITKTPFSIEHRLLMPDGRIKFVHERCETFYDSRGKLLNSIGTIQDITERKHAEEKNWQSEKKYRELFQINKDGIAIYLINPYGPPGMFVEVNDAAPKMLGYTKEEWLQISPIKLEPQITQEEFLSRRFDLETNGIVNYETINFHKNGQQVFLEVTAQLIQYEGKPAVMTIARDVSERKQREKELQAIASLAAALRTAPTRADILPVIMEQICYLLNSETVSVEIIDPKTNESVTEVACGVWAPVIGFRQPPGTGLNAVISETRKPFLNNNLKDESRLVAPSDYVEKSILAGAGVPLIAQNQLIGFLWMGRKKDIDESEVRLLASVADMAANAIHRATLHEQTQKDAANLAQAYDTTLEGWAHALELRDHETEGHSRNVVTMTVALARNMGINIDNLENIKRGALLHDIGKIGVPDSVLLKPGTLNEREWEIMRRHPEYGYDLIKQIDYLRPVLDIPYCHHEKWDGSGYPRGLKGEDIPIEARIFAIVDVWDALTTDRPYRKAWSYEQSYEHIKEQAGKHFDPRVVKAFLEMLDSQHLDTAEIKQTQNS